MKRSVAAIVTALAAIGLLTACQSTPGVAKGTVSVVAAENEYGNVAQQIGGRFVSVTSVESNPNTDPHTYEVSPSIAGAIAGAQVVIQNGAGYDDFMSKIESASSSSSRDVIDVQNLLGLPDITSNPHLWYKPATMPAVAHQLAADFSQLQPGHASYFQANVSKFDASLKPWLNAIAAFKRAHPDTPVATTEPVADYLLEAAGTRNKTPFSLQADIMNGVDPAPQAISLQDNLFANHSVKAFVYNQQVTDALTQSFIGQAQAAGVPVVGVYETMPTPGYDYQSWMLAEVRALNRAITKQRSTEKL